MAIAKDGMSESARKELTESRRRIEELTSQLAKLSSEVGSQSPQHPAREVSTVEMAFRLR